MKKLISILLTLCLALACLPALGESAASNVNLDDYFSKRDLKATWDESEAETITLTGGSASTDSKNVTVSGGSVTITAAGTYLIQGTLNDGTISVVAGDDDKVQLVLMGASITSADSAAICVENADKVFITLAEGTENTLSNGGSFSSDTIDAVIFSRDDLTLNGTGSLTITSPAGHGIVGKDDLKITGGTYVITAQDRGIDANDSVRIYDGSFTIVSGKDAIRAKNEEDTSKGYVLIVNGAFSITAGGGAANGETHTDSMFGGRGGFGGWNNSSSASSDTPSMKGVKASGEMILLGGSFTVDSADDAFHTDSSMTVYGGSYAVSTGDDAFHADASLTIYDGVIHISRSYEGIEGQKITIAGGSISLVSSDDGVNAGGGNDASGFGGWQDMFSSDGVSSILISGGTLYVNASGDGLDSNGSLTVTGGTIVVSGPTNSGNGALDCAGTATITGGTVIAAGATGMAENFGSSSTQVSMLVNLNGQAGTVTVKDSSGNVILTGNVEKQFGCVVISSPDLKVGETYTVSCGSSSASVTVTSTIMGGGMGGFGGGRNYQQQPGGMGGQQPGGMGGQQPGGFGGHGGGRH